MSTLNSRRSSSDQEATDRSTQDAATLESQDAVPGRCQTINDGLADKLQG